MWFVWFVVKNGFDDFARHDFAAVFVLPIAPVEAGRAMNRLRKENPQPGAISAKEKPKSVEYSRDRTDMLDWLCPQFHQPGRMRPLPSLPSAIRTAPGKLS